MRILTGIARTLVKLALFLLFVWLCEMYAEYLACPFFPREK